jgi:hypothetical protein
MASLIITRPRMQRLEKLVSYDLPAYGIPIRVDDRQVASVLPGTTIEWELAPGHHEIRAGSRVYGSQPVEIQAVSAEKRWFAVGVSEHSLKMTILLSIPLILSFLLFFMFTMGPSQQGRQGTLAATSDGWFNVLELLLAMLMILAVLLQVWIMVRLRPFDLVEIADLDWSDLGWLEEQIADRLRSQPNRVKIPIWQMMVAVALLALFLGAAMAWTRYQRSEYFRLQARLHADIEAVVRQYAPNQHARADYHAALKRKYEQAAAQGRFSVEPDPPEPTVP